MQKQVNGYLRDYRNGHNTHHALLVLTEKWKKNLDDKDYGGAVLIDLSKVFDTLNHDLLTAKFSAYGFEHGA